MSDSTYKIGVVIEGDASRFTAAAKSSEKAITDLTSKGSSDISKFKANISELFSSRAMDTGLGGFAEKIGKGTGALEAFAGPAGIAAGAIVGIGSAAVVTGKALFDMAKEASDYGSEIADAEAKTGLTAESLSSLRYQAQLSGSDFGEVSGAISKFSKLVAEAARGSEEAKGKLKALGVDPQAAVKDLDGALTKVFATINDAKSGVEQMTAAQDAFGKSGANLIPLITSMDGDFAALKKRANELGIVLSEEDVKAADAFGDTLDTLSIQAKATSAKFALQFAPDITRAMDVVSHAVSDNQSTVVIWGGIISDVFRGTETAIERLQQSFDNSLTGMGLKLLDTATKARMLLSIISPAAAWISYFSGLEGGVKGETEFGAKRDFVDNGADYLTNSAKAAKPKKEKEAKELSINDLLDAMRRGTMSQESGGRQGIRNPRTGATGLFQVTPENIRNWTRETFGREMSVAEFKKNAQAQIAIFNKYMGQYLKQGLAEAGGQWEEGVRRAAVRWYGTKANGDDFAEMKRFRPDEPSRGEYTASVLARTKAALGNKFKTDLPILGEAQISPAVKLLEEYDRKLSDIGVTGERMRVENLLQTKAYQDITGEQRESILARADEIDYFNQASKAGANYSNFVESLSKQYDELTGVQKTATDMLNDYLNDIKEAGVVLDAASEAAARWKAFQIDSINANGKISALESDIIEKRKQDRDAIWEQVYAAQALRHEIDKTQATPEDKYGIAYPGQGELDRMQKEDDATVAPGKRKGFWSEFEKGIFGENGAEKVQSQTDIMKASIQDLGQMTGEVFANMSDAVGSAIEGYLLYGESVGKALQQAAAAELAHISSVSAIKAIYETAQGVASLFYNPGAAALHFKAAALYAAVAVGAGAAAKTIAPESRGGASSGNNAGAAGASGSGNYFSTDDDKKLEFTRNQDTLRQSQQDKQSIEFRKELQMLSNSINSLDNRISSQPPENVLTNGIKRSPGLISDTNISELKKNSTKAGEFGRTLGLK